MALVDYSSSGDEADDVRTISRSTALKRPREDSDNNDDNDNNKHNKPSSDLPPLPSKFYDLYASTTRVGTRDDPSLHGGRKRVTPHIEGNWPTHLYIEWYPLTIEHESLTSLISTLKGAIPSEGSKIQSLLTSDLGAPLPLHVSLSRPIGFATEQRHRFVASLERTIRSAGIRPFDITFSRLDWVPNFEGTRWFLVLRLNVPDSNGLNRLLHACNKVVQEHGQPPLYTKTIEKNPQPMESFKNASKVSRPFGSDVEGNSMQDVSDDVSDAFHISIAWTLEPPSLDLLKATESTAKGQFQDVKKMLVKVEEVKAKVGNVVTNICLQKNVLEGKGLFGL